MTDDQKHEEALRKLRAELEPIAKVYFTSEEAIPLRQSLQKGKEPSLGGLRYELKDLPKWKIGIQHDFADLFSVTVSGFITNEFSGSPVPWTAVAFSCRFRELKSRLGKMMVDLIAVYAKPPK